MRSILQCLRRDVDEWTHVGFLLFLLQAPTHTHNTSMKKKHQKGTDGANLKPRLYHFARRKLQVVARKSSFQGNSLANYSSRFCRDATTKDFDRFAAHFVEILVTFVSFCQGITATGSTSAVHFIFSQTTSSDFPRTAFTIQTLWYA